MAAGPGALGPAVNLIKSSGSRLHGLAAGAIVKLATRFMGAAFDRTYKAWRDQPFPRASADKELAGVHADLVLVDAWVAEAVIPFVERKQYVFAVVDVSAGIASIHARAAQLAASCNGDDAELARAYAAYAERLDAVYGEFERTVGEAGLSN